MVSSSLSRKNVTNVVITMVSGVSVQVSVKQLESLDAGRLESFLAFEPPGLPASEPPSFFGFEL
jgi:hypothetical protein